MTKPVEIIFSNSDAAENLIGITVGSMEDADYVLSWYGGFYASDNYDAIIDGEYQELDIDGNRAALGLRS